MTPRATLVLTAAAALLARTALAFTVAATNTTTTSRACQNNNPAPYCNPALSLDERIDDLIERLWNTSSTKIPDLLTARTKNNSALPALSIPEYDWGLNCIHGVQSGCVRMPDGTVLCPTSFMNPVNFGFMFNKSMAFEMGAVIATEARALWLLGAEEQSATETGQHIGLDCWSPNINIARDPRWGRNQEVPSEDPFVNGEFGSAYSQGLQQGEDPAHLKTLPTLKHWDAYSLEDAGGFTRHNFNAVVSQFALADTYFPAFKQSVMEGKAAGVMCSYNAVNSVPTCASAFLTKVLRDTWNFDGYVTSDSGAIEDIYSQHKYVADALHAVAPALRDGQTDVCSGGVYTSQLLPALAAGLISREDIDLALRHVLAIRFRLGLFDPIESQPYWHVAPSAIGSQQAYAVNLLATQSSMVLLKNTGSTLPFPKGKRIAIIGPHANATQAMVGNYLGQICPSNKFECIISPFDALTAMNTGGTVTYTAGCALNNNSTAGFAAAVAAAQAADYVVLGLGIDGSLEGEAHDRTSIDLPSIQHQLAAAIAAVGKPTAIVLLHGGAVDISAEASNPAIGAILEAGYPGFLGGTVIAQTLLGDNDHLGGKLATTVYPAAYVNEINMTEMELDVGVGRGYRYYTGVPVFEFGFGLAYTTFTLQPASAESSTSTPKSASAQSASAPASYHWSTNANAVLALRTEAIASTRALYAINVTNTGTRTGDEVVQAYMWPLSTPSQPRSRLIRQLFDYKRVHLAPGQSEVVTFSASSATLRMVHRETGDTVSTPGTFKLQFTNGAGVEIVRNVKVEGPEVLVEAFPEV